SGLAHHLVAGLERRDVRSERPDGPSDVPPSDLLLRSTEPDHGPGDERATRHEVPHVRPGSRGAHPDEHLVLPHHRILDVPKLEHVRRPVPVLNDRLHGFLSFILRCTAYTYRTRLGVRRTLCQLGRPGSRARVWGAMATRVEE